MDLPEVSGSANQVYMSVVFAASVDSGPARDEAMGG